MDELYNCYLSIDGVSWAGKSYLLNELKSQQVQIRQNFRIFYLEEFHEYFAKQQIFYKNLSTPKNLSHFFRNENFFSKIEFSLWHHHDQDKKSLLDQFKEHDLLVRDRSFLSTLAFSHLFQSLFKKQSDQIDLLNSFRELILNQKIPIPTHVIFIKVTRDFIKKRVELNQSNRNSMWQNIELLMLMNHCIEKLFDFIFQEMDVHFLKLNDYDFENHRSKAFDFIENATKVSPNQLDQARNHLVSQLMSYQPSIILPEAIGLVSFDSIKSIFLMEKDKTEKKSFSEMIEDWRNQAKQLWQQSRSILDDDDIAKELPEYFLDRHAYLLFRSDQYLSDLSEEDRLICQPRFQDYIIDWHEKIKIKRTPIESISRFIPDLNDQCLHFKVRLKLLNLWRSYLDSLNIEYPTHLFTVNPTDTWLSLFKKSAHYPFRLPAILGPSFFDRLSGHYKMKVLNLFHYDDLWEIYAFILQVHEEVHLFQKGEPMFSEFLLSYIWCQFLDQHDFWFWQESDENGESFNRERDWVRKIKLTNHEIKLLFKDHLIGVSHIFKSKLAYDLICEGAWLFDHHQLKYKQYLDFIVWCFENKDHEDIIELSREKWGIIC